MNTFTALPAVGNGGMSLVVATVGGTVVGSLSFLARNTKTSTTMRMIKRTNATAAAVIILHFLELQGNEKNIYHLMHWKGTEHSMQSTLLQNPSWETTGGTGDVKLGKTRRRKLGCGPTYEKRGKTRVTDARRCKMF